MEDVPAPSHNPKAYQINAFVSNNSRLSNEDLSLYKDLMQMLVERQPELRPTLLTHENNLTHDFTQLDEAEQRKQYRAWAGKIIKLVKPLLADEEFLVGLCTEMECTFLDIIHCLYSYYGALIYKQPQFSRWLSTTLGAFSDESKKALSIPR